MQSHRRRVSRCISRMLTWTICSAAALALLLAAPDAMSQVAVQNATASDNANPFSRWFRMPSAATAPATAAPITVQPEQRARKIRTSRSKTRARPVAAKPAPVEEQKPVPVEEQPAPQVQELVADWPHAATNVGGIMIAPVTIKTVREQLEPEPEAQLVSENEMSDIDRAAQPTLAAAAPPEPAAGTDGRGMTDHEGAPEQARVFAMGEAMKAVMQSAWLEPIFLMLAGALAALSAVRVFA